MKKAKLDEDVAKMVAEDYAPFSVVDHTGLKRLLRDLNCR